MSQSTPLTTLTCFLQLPRLANLFGSALLFSLVPMGHPTDPQSTQTQDPGTRKNPVLEAGLLETERENCHVCFTVTDHSSQVTVYSPSEILRMSAGWLLCAGCRPLSLSLFRTPCLHRPLASHLCPVSLLALAPLTLHPTAFNQLRISVARVTSPAKACRP